MENSAIERVFGGSNTILRPILVSDIRKRFKLATKRPKKKKLGDGHLLLYSVYFHVTIYIML